MKNLKSITFVKVSVLNLIFESDMKYKKLSYFSSVHNYGLVYPRIKKSIKYAVSLTSIENFNVFCFKTWLHKNNNTGLCWTVEELMCAHMTINSSDHNSFLYQKHDFHFTIGRASNSNIGNCHFVKLYIHFAT